VISALEFQHRRQGLRPRPWSHAFGPEGRRRLAGGVSHRNRRPTACAPAGASEANARTVLSPLRGLAVFCGRSGGSRHRLISVGPSGTVPTGTVPAALTRGSSSANCDLSAPTRFAKAAFSPEGAEFDSPGQRPGCRKKNGPALKGRQNRRGLFRPFRAGALRPRTQGAALGCQLVGLRPFGSLRAGRDAAAILSPVPGFRRAPHFRWSLVNPHPHSHQCYTAPIATTSQSESEPWP
jgi:hypothetical protein